jgi:hypothetical protein
VLLGSYRIGVSLLFSGTDCCCRNSLQPLYAAGDGLDLRGRSELRISSNAALMRTISAADLGGSYAETDGLRYVCRLARGAAQ